MKRERRKETLRRGKEVMIRGSPVRGGAPKSRKKEKRKKKIIRGTGKNAKKKDLA